MDMERLRNLIKATRLKNGKTQQQIADHLHLSVSSYNKMETGKTDLSVPHFFEIIAYLNIPLRAVFTEDYFTKNSLCNLFEECPLRRELATLEDNWASKMKDWLKEKELHPPTS